MAWDGRKVHRDFPAKLFTRNCPTRDDGRPTLTKLARAACRKMFGRMQGLPDGERRNAVRVSAHLANRGAASWAAPKQTPESHRRSSHADFDLGVSWIDR